MLESIIEDLVNKKMTAAQTRLHLLQLNTRSSTNIALL